MTLHRLHAGDGYTYLTRQVAACDHTVTRGQNIADYYTAEGAPPGRWAGRGAAALGVDGVVSETQMKALFGEGLHPDAEANITRAALSGEDVDRTAAAQQLGRPFPTFENKVPYLAAVKEATTAAAKESGKALSAGERQRIRVDTAAAFYRAEHGRDGAPKELTEFIRAQEAKVRHPVAGYDLVFTPQKSISALWGLGDAAAKDAVERAHTEAVNETLAWIETEAGFTRRGKGSTEQVETDGLVATQFVHYDNRTGDPNLHTHCAISNKVRTADDGKWRALDARPLHRIAVAAAARYNSLVADKTARYAGVAFEDRARPDGKRPVREIVGFDPELLSEFSRRDAIMARARELTEDYRAEHGRTPSKAQQIRLVQQATLDTRSGKAPPVSLSVMRTQWRERAETFLAERGIEGGVDALLASVQTPMANFDVVTDVDTQLWARRVIDRVSTARSTWTEANVRTVVEDELSRVRFAEPEQARRAVEQVTRAALHRDSMLLDIGLDTLPAALTRSSGESVFTDHGAARYSSEAVLAAEQRLLDAAHTQTVFTVSAEAFDGARARREALETARSGGEFVFNPGQLALARHLATAETVVAVGIGPAGTGKTASMKLLVDAWHEQGRSVLALGPSAAAATVLGEDVGVSGQTIAMVLHKHRLGADTGIETGTLILVDEAGMASTRDLDQLVALAAERGAVVRMIGDSAQLNAVDAGGALGMLARETSAPELVDVVRFRDPDEAAASLALRVGDPAGIDFYARRDRMIGGTVDELLVRILDDHLADTAAGKSSVMLAPTNDEVHHLNTAAQAIHQAAGDVATGHSAALSDSARAYVGDVVVTRRNRAELRAVGVNGTQFSVQNGNLWTVDQVHTDGALTVTAHRHGASITLPAWYVRDHTQLGYAHTIHRAQGLTVDVGRAVLTASVDRQGAYVAQTRGRDGNYAYLVTDAVPGPDLDHRPDTEVTARGVFESILARDGEERAAVEHLRDGLARASDPRRFRDYYDTAVVKLGDAHARHLLSATLPTAIHTAATGQRGWDAAVAGVRDVLARGADRNVVIDLLGDPDLHTARNVPVAILARLKTVEVPENGSTLPVLPPEHPGADTELRAFAENTVAAIVDPHGADTVWATDLDYTHPQDQAYRNAVRALLDADALDAVRRTVPETAAADFTDRDWTELSRRVADLAAGIDRADVGGGDPVLEDAARTAATALLDRGRIADPELAQYTDELRDYLDLPAVRDHDAASRITDEAPVRRDVTADRRIDPRVAAEMTADPVRMLTRDELDAAASAAARHRAALDQQARLARAAKAAAIGGRSVAAVRDEHQRLAAPAAAVAELHRARARKEQLDAQFTDTVRALDAATGDLASAGRFAGAAKADARERIATHTAERDRLNAARFEAEEQLRRAAAAAPPRAQRDAIVAAAQRSAETIDDRIEAAARRDAATVRQADRALELVDAECGVVADRTRGIGAEVQRRSDLDELTAQAEQRVREAAAPERDAEVRDGERYRVVAHVAAQAEQLHRQQQRQAVQHAQRERGGNDLEL
ncbi:MobF family relaxase [Rhodococcoides kroppenstedtii]|uniref:MobF family relaxase n=1 Tax=Rhodococcoides kroppenstedtii TaxID=293050 RepID=UPI003629BE42